MTVAQRKPLLIAGVVAAVAVALALGVSLNTLLLLGAALLCPAAMFFGMGTRRGCGHAESHPRPKGAGEECRAEDRDRPRAA